MSDPISEDFTRAGVNTPPGLPGWALALWVAKLRLQRLLLVGLGATLCLLVFAGVISRYLLGQSIFWLEDVVRFTAIGLYFIGAAHGTWERGHISASLAELIFPAPAAQRAVAVIVAAISLGLCGWMTLWAWDYLGFVIRRGTVSLETGVPMAWVVGVMPVTLALMTLYFAVELGLRARLLLTGKGA